MSKFIEFSKTVRSNTANSKHRMCFFGNPSVAGVSPQMWNQQLFYTRRILKAEDIIVQYSPLTMGIYLKIKYSKLK